MNNGRRWAAGAAAIGVLVALFLLFSTRSVDGPAHERVAVPISSLDTPPERRTTLRRAAPDAPEDDPSPGEQELHDVMAQVDHHILVRCHVGEEFDVDVNVLALGTIRDGHFHLLTDELEGELEHDLPTEPFRVRWKAERYGEVVPCTVERIRFAYVELRFVDPDGRPVVGLHPHHEGLGWSLDGLQERQTDEDGAIRLQVEAGKATVVEAPPLITEVWAPDAFDIPALEPGEHWTKTYQVEVVEKALQVADPVDECQDWREWKAIEATNQARAAELDDLVEKRRRDQREMETLFRRHASSHPYWDSMHQELARLRRNDEERAPQRQELETAARAAMEAHDQMMALRCADH